jgi:N-acetylmuramic acid 6-phosphate etherase
LGEIRVAATAAQPVTEQRHPRAQGLDALPGAEVLAVILDQQARSVAAVADALPQIDRAADLVAAALRGGGRLVYAGAGSSALMANADGLELHGTYGVDPARIRLLMAGGLPVDARMPGETEDDTAAALAGVADLGPADIVIAVTASGRTPFALAAAEGARARGAKVVAIVNNAGAPLFALADVAIHLATPPEVIAGSTRMGAGTAQKVALNMISTLAGIRLGQVHDGMMVGVVADNAKLRARATGMVAAIAGVGPEAARAALHTAGGEVKPAVLVALGETLDSARALLKDAGGNLRAALGLRNNGG